MCMQAATGRGIPWQDYLAARREELSRKAPKRGTEATSAPVSCRQHRREDRVRHGTHGRRIRV
jgi:hypothetical protein